MTDNDRIKDSIGVVKKRAREFFGEDSLLLDNEDEQSTKMYISVKAKQHKQFEKLPSYIQDKMDNAAGVRRSVLSKMNDEKVDVALDEETSALGDKVTSKVILELTEIRQEPMTSQALTLADPALKDELPLFMRTGASRSLQLFQQETENALNLTKPEWHAPWKLMRVIAGHSGWVRSLAMDPENQWFASGSADRTIKIWDLSSAKLKLTLTGHIMAIRGIVVSPRHPYMFSCSEDKTIKCWDLEKNKVIRDYHGHLSSVYTIDMHPTTDIIATGGRDSSVRIWDIRTRVPIHVLTGHTSSVTNVKCQATAPQIVSTSMDSTVRTYDLIAGKTMQVLTHHRKSVRGLAIHELENTFATGSSDNIKQWKFPDGVFLQNFEPRHNAIVNTLSVNQSNVLFSGADNGTMSFFDWKSGHKFQASETVMMPGSSESEKSIYCSTFDKSGLRLLTGEADKSIKVWREDPDATEESHPGIPWNPGQRDLY